MFATIVTDHLGNPMAETHSPYAPKLKQTASPSRSKPRHRSGGRTQTPAKPRAAWLAGLTAVGILAAILLLWQKGSAEGGGTYTVIVGKSEVIKDSAGLPVRVSGPTPAEVLEAFCRVSSAEAVVTPVRLIPSSIQPGRVGIFEIDGELRSIRIREDRASSRWVAGDGTTPIEISAAPLGVTAEE